MKGVEESVGGDPDDLSPRTWRRFYAAVIAELAALVVLFYALTWWAA